MLTEENSGMTADHIRAIQRVAVDYATFIFVRPVNPDATSLIAAGYRTKRLDIHAKSSNWGPMSGFICVDPELSKVVDEGDEALARNRRAARHALHADGVGRVPLAIPRARIDELVRKGLFSQVRAGEIFEASSAGKKKRMRFQFEPNSDGRYDVFYFPLGGKEKRPVMVLGYKEGGAVLAVTADYDLFAVCPHFSAPGFSADSVTRVKERGLLGTLSRFQHDLIGAINRRCGAHPVVNHGTELNNPFPESDRRLAMFTPGGHSRLVDRSSLHRIFGDLAMHGFHVYANQRWNAAVRSHVGSNISRLQSAARRGAYRLTCLREADFNQLSIAGYAGETRTAFAQQRFGAEIANGRAASVRPGWRP